MDTTEKKETNKFTKKENIKENKTEPLSEKQIELIKKLITESNYSQDSIAAEVGCSQTSVSRIKRKLGLSRKSKFKLEDCLKKAYITQPSVFFINVGIKYRDSLAEHLLAMFPDTTEAYGILYIQKTTNPSGLLIFSNNHNLMHEINAIPDK